MTAGWKATVDSGRRLAAWAERTQERGRALAELQRRTADQAEGLRHLQEGMQRLQEVAKRMVGPCK